MIAADGGGTECIMNNGDSFHNGAANQEFQKRNRMNLQSAAGNTDAAGSAASGADTRAPVPDEPTPAPTPSDGDGAPSQDNRATPATDGSDRPSPAPQPAPVPTREHRGYIDVYARRVAERQENSLDGDNHGGENRPDEFGNTPAPSGIPSGSVGGGGGSGVPYYEEGSRTAVYVADPAEVARKDKWNLLSMIMGIVSFAGNILCLTCLTPVTAILAIVFGCLGRVGGKFQSKGVAGLVLGIVYCALTLLLFLFIIVMAVIGSSEDAGVAL